jgi:hypothetical protein
LQQIRLHRIGVNRSGLIGLRHESLYHKRSCQLLAELRELRKCGGSHAQGPSYFGLDDTIPLSASEESLSRRGRSQVPAFRFVPANQALFCIAG